MKSFEGSINRNLPHLKSINPALFNYLESIQPYHQSYSWLADFASVTIDSKHCRLTPQTRTEAQRVVSKHSNGGVVSWDPAHVVFGQGVFINGAPVNCEAQLPIPTPETSVTKEIWVDFKFDNSISVLPLLKQLLIKIPEIIKQIYKLI